MPRNLPADIILTTPQWFEECLKRGCTVFDFPSGHRPRNVEKLRSGSICLVLVKPRPKAPRSEWAFVGEFTVKDVKLVRGEEFRERYASRAVEATIPFPRLGEASWVIEFEKLVKYERPVKLSECSDVRTSTSERPVSEWAIRGFMYIKPEDSLGFVDAIRRKSRRELSLELKVLQEAREVLRRHEEGEVINLVASMIESSDRCFDFVDRELHNIRELLEAIKPWYRGLDEERELAFLEGRLKPLKDKAKPFLSMLKKREIRGLGYLSFDEVLYVTREAIVTVESVEKLWRRVERVAQALLRQAEAFEQRMRELEGG